MKRASYNEETYVKAKVKGIECEFSSSRITPESIPTGKHFYEVAGDDDCGDTPCRVQRGVAVNFYGTLITDTLMPLDDEGVLWLGKGDFEWV